jgi:hypothetical protein
MSAPSNFAREAKRLQRRRSGPRNRGVNGFRERGAGEIGGDGGIRTLDTALDRITV